MHPEPPHENTLTIPDTWLRAVHPRRDGIAVPVAKPGRKALADVRRFVDGSDGVVDALLTGGRGDAELIEAARRHWGGEPDPAGAAVIAAVVSLADSLAPGTARRHAPDKAAHVLRAFADYEILQPFEQLTRPVHAPAGEERDGARLRRFEGLTVPIAALLALVRKGWEPGEICDGGGVVDVSFRFAPGRRVRIGLDPGFGIGHMAEGDDQTLRDVWIGADDGALRLGDLDPVVASELLAYLEFLAAAAD